MVGECLGECVCWECEGGGGGGGGGAGSVRGGGGGSGSTYGRGVSGGVCPEGPAVSSRVLTSLLLCLPLQEFKVGIEWPQCLPGMCVRLVRERGRGRGRGGRGR